MTLRCVTRTTSRSVISKTLTITEPPGNLPPVPVVSSPACTAPTCNAPASDSTDPNPDDTFSRLWNFGDGDDQHLDGPRRKSYANNGTFTVTLIVTDGWGDFATTTRLVTITKPPTNAAPTPIISAARLCAPHGRATSSAQARPIPNSNAITYLWNWGDATSDQHWGRAVHTFLANGPYTVTLTATDAWGDFASATRVVSFTERPRTWRRCR